MRRTHAGTAMILALALFGAPSGPLAGQRMPPSIQQIAKQVDGIDIGHFTAASDIIGLSPSAPFHYFPYGPAVILDIQPVPDIAAVTVDRQRFVFQSI